MITRTVRGLRRADRTSVISLVSLGHFLSHVYFLTLPPLFPLIAPDFSLNNAELGFAMGLLYLGPFLFQLPVGWLVDRVGAKWLIVGGLLLAGGGLMLAALAPGYPTLLAMVFVAGVGLAVFHPADYALLDIVSTADAKGKSFSVHTFAGFVGSAAAPVAIGTAGLQYGWRTSIAAVGALGLCYALVIAVFLEGIYTDHVDDERGDADGAGTGDGASVSRLSELAADARGLAHPVTIGMFVFMVLIVMAEVGIMSFTVVFITDAFSFSSVVGNTSLTAFFSLTAVGILVGGVLADRRSPTGIIVLSMLSLVGLVWLLALGGLVVVPAIAIGAFGVGGFLYGLVQPSRDRLISYVADDDSVGQNFGLVFTGASLGGIVSPTLLGAVIDATSATVAFLLVGAFFLFAVVTIVAVRRRIRGTA